MLLTAHFVLSLLTRAHLRSQGAECKLATAKGHANGPPKVATAAGAVVECTALPGGGGCGFPTKPNVTYLISWS